MALAGPSGPGTGTTRCQCRPHGPAAGAARLWSGPPRGADGGREQRRGDLDAAGRIGWGRQRRSAPPGRAYESRRQAGGVERNYPARVLEPRAAGLDSAAGRTEVSESDPARAQWVAVWSDGRSGRRPPRRGKGPGGGSLSDGRHESYLAVTQPRRQRPGLGECPALRPGPGVVAARPAPGPGAGAVGRAAPGNRIRVMPRSVIGGQARQLSISPPIMIIAIIVNQTMIKNQTRLRPPASAEAYRHHHRHWHSKAPPRRRAAGFRRIGPGRHLPLGTQVCQRPGTQPQQPDAP